MPKITIYEEDYTGNGRASRVNQTVFIPGACSVTNPSGGTAFAVGQEFEITGTSTDFAAIVNSDNLESVNNDDGYKMACRLLDLGMTVFYVAVGAFSGESGESIDRSKTTQSANWWATYEDISAYPARFITTGGDSSAAANKYAAATAAARGNSIALVHIPDATASDYEESYKYINTDAQNGLAGIATNVAKYVSGFVPNFSIILEDGSEDHYPGYMAYLGCYASYVNKFASWFAMAGAQRGFLPWTVALDANFGTKAIDKLQKREESTSSADPVKYPRALNPICYKRGYGDVIWGNRTLYPVSNGIANSKAKGLTASSFLNIRMLVSDIKDHLTNVAEACTFDPNSSLLWTRFYNAVVPLLEDMKTNQGIKGYKLTQIKDAPKATLKAVLRIIPIEAVEDFVFNIELADSIEITEE